MFVNANDLQENICFYGVCLHLKIASENILRCLVQRKMKKKKTETHYWLQIHHRNAPLMHSKPP